jgi:transcriptional regulator with XRE-family HTH domain
VVADPVPSIQQLGAAIRQLREEDKSGISGEGLAREAGVDPAHVNRAENHGRNFTWETPGALVEVLGIPLSTLVLRAEKIADSERAAKTGDDRA